MLPPGKPSVFEQMALDDLSDLKQLVLHLESVGCLKQGAIPAFMYEVEEGALAFWKMLQTSEGVNAIREALEKARETGLRISFAKHNLEDFIPPNPRRPNPKD
jgi:hypothetical protein